VDCVDLRVHGDILVSSFRADISGTKLMRNISRNGQKQSDRNRLHEEPVSTPLLQLVMPRDVPSLP
jgi:hypothetical protein